MVSEFRLSLQYVKPKEIIMNTKVKLSVTLEFSDKVTSDEDINDIVNNVMDGLIEQTNHEGLAPLDGDVVTKSINVTDNNDTELNHKFY